MLITLTCNDQGQRVKGYTHHPVLELSGTEGQLLVMAFHKAVEPKENITIYYNPIWGFPISCGISQNKQIMGDRIQNKEERIS